MQWILLSACKTCSAWNHTLLALQRYTWWQGGSNHYDWCQRVLGSLGHATHDKWQLFGAHQARELLQLPQRTPNQSRGAT